MAERTFRAHLESDLADIRSLLDRAIRLQESKLAVDPGEMVREQASHSARSVELAGIRTDLSRERSKLARQRTEMAQSRTELSGQRTGMASSRTELSTRRTVLAEDRNRLASTRTLLSRLRTELARGRTALALIRTGLAFLTLGIALFRLFGPSLWSLFDAGLVLASLVMTVVGIRSYARVVRTTADLDRRLEEATV